MLNFKKTNNLVILLFLLLLLPFFIVQADTSPEPPKIIPRADWEADENLAASLGKDSPPEYPEKVEKIVIHHTASTNLVPDTDGSGYYKGMIRNMFYFHTVYKQWYENGVSNNGFGDIGYNYIIDPNGNIYEGRKGGNGVIGAHAKGFNTGSIGISLIGTYGGTINGKYINDTLTSKTKSALENLVGWLAATNNIDTKNKSLFNEKMIYGVVGHRDVGATQCPGENIYSSLSQIRTNTAALAATFSSYAYKADSGSDYYILKNGKRFTYNSLADLQKFNPNYTKIVSLPAKQIQAYETSAAPKYADGSLLRIAGGANIYFLENGQKRLLQTTAEEFANLGFKWNEVKDVLESDLAYFPVGLSIKYGADGKLLADTNDNVYLVEQGKLKRFTSALLFNILNFSWNKIEKVDTSEFNSHIQEGVVSYPDDILIKGESPTVYVIEQEQKKPITSLTLFNALEYSWDDLIQTSDVELSNYNLANPVVFPDNSLVKSSSPDVYLIDNGEKKVFTSGLLFENLGFEWSNIYNLHKDEISLYQNGGYVTYPDGTLLKATDGYKVYVLENGQKKWIQTAEEFIAGNYKWEQIKLTLSSDLDIYPDLGSNSQVEPSVIPAEAGIQESEENIESHPELDSGSQDSTEKYEIPDQVRNDNSIMKVSLGSFSQNISISAEGTSVSSGFKVYENNQLIVEKKVGEIYTTTIKNNLDIECKPDSTDVILIVHSKDNQVYNEANPFHPGYGGVTDNRFRGNIRLKYSANSGKYWIINELPMEDYLNGVAEASNLDNSEYLKTFSIMIRSYAKHYLDKGGKHPNEPFYLKNSLNSNGNDQIYKGYGYEKRAPNVIVANTATKGIVATYNGEAIRAAYSSDSGGTTWDARLQHYIYYNTQGELVHTATKPTTGNFYTVWTGGSAYEDRPYLYGGMPDPAGTIHVNSRIIISHGVGVSTAGARKMAENGKSYEEILKYYYPGVEIE